MSDAEQAETTIRELLEGYRLRRFLVSDVVAESLDRINRWDRRGPMLNAMISLAGDVDAQVAAVERSTAEGDPVRPLHGVPIVIKDNINVDGLATTGGCAALAELHPGADAEVVARLKAAGAVVLGKTSMSEFAWGTYDTENSIVDGYTRNPYQPDYATGGSSGGTGAAVAAGYCVAGLGTDTGCSVRAPASINCLVGLRPTHGLISMRGVMPMNADWDTVGPMARTIDDLAVVLDVVTGSTKQWGPHSRALAEPSQPPARVGVLRQLCDPENCDGDIISVLDQAMKDFASTGAAVIDPLSSDVFGVGFDSFDWYLRFRFDLDEFLAEMGERTPLHSLAEILDSGVVLERYREPLEQSLEWPFSPPQHPRIEQMNNVRDQYRDAVQSLMQQHSLDALAFPTFRQPPVRNGELAGARSGSDTRVGSNNYYASLTGFPAINVPMGFVEPGLPVGLQLLGRPNSEARLLQIARQYESCTRHRRPPRMKD
jgi:amidase